MIFPSSTRVLIAFLTICSSVLPSPLTLIPFLGLVLIPSYILVVPWIKENTAAASSAARSATSFTQYLLPFARLALLAYFLSCYLTLSNPEQLEDLVPSFTNPGYPQGLTFTKDYHKNGKSLDALTVDSVSVQERGGWIQDELGRVVLFHGVNLGGNTKIPFSPPGDTHLPATEDFLDLSKQGKISFVNRPFPLEEADEHFARLKMWGLTVLRFLVTWEAIEHKGPGQYDKEYMEYVRRIVRKAGEHGISVFIDPHQDVWSRHTGGDGAPLWTLDKVGFNVSNMHATGATFTHQQLNGEPMPQMIWATGYNRLAVATMFTLFFAGNEYAPKKMIDGLPAQEYLQSHYVNAIGELASYLANEPNVLGYDTLNEPSAGYVGLEDISKYSFPAPIGFAISPWMGMQLGAGKSMNVQFFPHAFLYEKTIIQNPTYKRAWKSDEEDVWLQHGVWKYDETNNTPQLLQPDYFATRRNTQRTKVDFVQDFMVPFFLRFSKTIRSRGSKKLMIFVEPIIDPNNPGNHPVAPKSMKSELSNWLWAPHFYDAVVLLTKTYRSWLALDLILSLPVVGPSAFVDHMMCRAVHHLRHSVGHADVPIMIGEVGIAMDLEHGKAFQKGMNHFALQVAALDRSMRCMEKTMIPYTIWNYCSTNSNKYGDSWNGEDLSLFSRDQQFEKNDMFSGGRALISAIRVGPRKISGIPISYEFLPLSAKREFSLVISRNPQSPKAPSIVFVPIFQYPQGFDVIQNGTGKVEIISKDQLLIWHHGESDVSGYYKLSLRAKNNN